MSRQPTLTDKDRLDAARAGFERYGADPARWPVDLRARAGDAVGDPALDESRTDAANVDALLNEADAPRAGAALENRLLADFDAARAGARGRSVAGGWFARLVGFSEGRPLVPAGALAGLAALGLGLGVVSAPTAGALSVEEEIYAYAVNSYIAYDADEESLWAAD